MWTNYARTSRNPDRFEYPRLDVSYHIRIVALQRGSATQSIRCRLFSVDFTGNPIYDALSYEWGLQSDDDQTILVNGSAHVVRKNLHDALISLRRPDAERFFWIDALCIDQENIIERNHQVELMSRIFGRAEQVIIWLGRTSDNSDGAIAHMERIHQVTHPFVGLALVNDTCYDAEMQAIAALCNRTYWQRIWIVQEVYLARRLMICCGERFLSWKSFYSTLRYTGNKINPLDTAILRQIRTSLAVQLARFKKFEGLLLCDWIRLTQKSLCTDPRDKVFALLGIAIDCVDNVRADYSKELPQIFEDVIRLYASNETNAERGRDVLAFTRILQESFGQHLPHAAPESWKTEFITAGALICGPITSISSETGFPPDAMKLPPKNVLSHLSEIHTLQDFENTILIENTPFFDLIRQSSDSAVIDKIIIPCKESRVIDLGSIFNSYRDILGTPTINQSRNTARYMFTDRHTGFAPSHTKEGDYLCLFQHTDFALIIRKGLNFWALVGRGSMLNPVDDDHAQIGLLLENTLTHVNRPLGTSELISLRLNIETLQKLTK